MIRAHRFAIGLAIVLSAARAFGEERITVDEAVQLAQAQNFSLRTVKTRAGETHDTAKVARAALLPSVEVVDLLQRWNCSAAVSIQPFGVACSDDVAAPTPPDLSAFTPEQQAQLGALVSSVSGSTPLLHEETTNIFVAVVTQPLLGLAHRSHTYKAARDSARAADAGTRVATDDVAQTVRTQFLRLFEARAVEKIAAASFAELQEEVADAKSRLTAQVITEADLLRVQVEAANAQQDETDARANGDVVRAQLLDTIGLSPTSGVQLVEPTALLAEAEQPLPDLGEAARTAVGRRAEVAEAMYKQRAAEHAASARRYMLAPEIDAQGAYIRADGQNVLPVNQAYIGLTARWPIWDWGARLYTARAAAREARATALALEDEQRSVAVDVQVALIRTKAAGSNVAVAKQTITSAEEAYRETKVRVKAGTATTTDLLDAHSALTKARMNLARAQYNHAIQHVALLRAMGH